jgi:hypothetical protein
VPEALRSGTELFADIVAKWRRVSPAPRKGVVERESGQDFVALSDLLSCWAFRLDRQVSAAQSFP